MKRGVRRVSLPLTPRLAAAFAMGSLLVGMLTGCVHRQPNPPLERVDASDGYYFHLRERPNNSRDTLFILCFSGGGTRAAALSYGVLEELRSTRYEREGGTRRLLDEVDAISSVSGGSVTAGAYALYGDEVFERLEHGFLKRNVQAELFWRSLNPCRWPKLGSKTFGRSDLAAELYDEILFGGATFADVGRQPGAYVLINATDISSGARFGFTQYQFDILCAELATLRLSQAVAASSAVPGLLSPITLNNYAGRVPSEFAREIERASAEDEEGVGSRARFHFAEMASYLDSTNRPYLHLVDGGVADNLGVRAVLDGIFAVESRPALRESLDITRVERVAIVVVNAFSKPDTGWSRSEQPPGTLSLVVAGASIPMDRYSYETIELLKEQVERFRETQRRARATGAQNGPEVRFYPMVISFAGLEDEAERKYLLEQPTSFHLPDESVDRLRRIGGKLLRQSPEFQSFLRDLGGGGESGGAKGAP